MEWQKYLELDMSAPDKQDYYLAQIACEMRRTIVKKPQDLKVQDFLLKFDPVDETVEDVTPEQLEKRRATRLAMSKMYWNALVNNSKQTPKKKKG